MTTVAKKKSKTKRSRAKNNAPEIAAKKRREKWDKENAFGEAIILAFDLPLKYDYTIPPIGDIEALVKCFSENKKCPKSFNKKLWQWIGGCRDEMTLLHSHIVGDPSVFGSEFFYGYGVLYRWRDGEKEKAEMRMNKYLTQTEKKYMKLLQETIKIRETAKPFENMKTNLGGI